MTLPMRAGLGPLRIITKMAGSVAENVPASLTEDQWLALIAAGDVVDAQGRKLDASDDVRASSAMYYYLEPAPETRVPFEIDILHRDDVLIAVDKPHFLATVPRGQHIRESALVRLRAMTGLADVVPLHRLDRMTAGVVLFVVDPAARRAYHDLFQSSGVRKVYEAIAPFRTDLDLPATVRTRIVKEHGVMVAREEPGESNSESHIELVEKLGSKALYRLRPITGKTHQLRLHMAHLGIPIDGDNYYPDYRPEREPTFTTPLQLLARSVEFTDPMTGESRRFTSRRELA